VIAIFVIIFLAIVWGTLMFSTRFIKHHVLRENIESYIYVAPAALLLLMFWFVPVVMSVFISFTDWTGASRLNTVNWLGIENYTKALQDPNFIQVFWNTVNYVIWSVPLTVCASLIVAMLLNNKMRGLGAFRTVYFLPFVTTWVAVSVVFKYVFNEQFGLANYILELLNLPTLGWLNESRGIIEMVVTNICTMLNITPPEHWHPFLAGPSLSMFTIIITSVWRDLGYFMIIFLAGLQNIDKSYYEAAEIDGATRFQQFSSITWPLLSPTTFFILVISLITAFKVFVPQFIMTPNGGPGRTTETLVFYLYREGFMGYRQLGYASAVAYILFAIILILTLFQNRFFGRKVHYD